METSPTNVVNVAAYRFVALDDLPKKRVEIFDVCNRLMLRGTVLLSREGINLFLAGTREAITELISWLGRYPGLENLETKESPSGNQPFTRLLVRIKKEIISLGAPEIQPAVKTSRKICPRELKSWLDGRRDVVLLDVRNDYEVAVGTFVGATPIGVRHFREFGNAVKRLPASWQERPIVMFCTGGIRCEKAGPMLENAGFKNVLQLDGGILKYFEDCGGDHFHGDCFVFDKRVAVDPHLNETSAGLCFACQAVLSEADQKSERYVPGETCPHCFRSRSEQMNAAIVQHRNQLYQLTNPLPGSMPRDNVRPLNVPQRFDRFTLFELLTRWHGHLGNGYWRSEIEQGRLTLDGRKLTQSSIVRTGMRIEHHLLSSVEPDVNADIEWLYEDESIIVINKPAPLPVHPCGRFCRNTLTYLLNEIYGQQKPRPAHRLDADTTGVLILSRTREVARVLQPQFERGQISKTYLARVIGVPLKEHFACALPIESGPTASGARRIADSGGLVATTRFQVRATISDRESILECFPETGRTNQIRAHLASLGHPIIGDRLYADPLPRNESQARTILATGYDSSFSRDLSRPELGEGRLLTRPGVQFVGAATNKCGQSPLCLHAWKLTIRHPVDTKLMEFVAPRPTWAVINDPDADPA